MGMAFGRRSKSDHARRSGNKHSSSGALPAVHMEPLESRVLLSAITPIDLPPPDAQPHAATDASSTVVAEQAPETASAAVTNQQQVVFQPAPADSAAAFTAKDGNYT